MTTLTLEQNHLPEFIFTTLNFCDHLSGYFGSAIPYLDFPGAALDFV